MSLPAFSVNFELQFELPEKGSFELLELPHVMNSNNYHSVVLDKKSVKISKSSGLIADLKGFFVSFSRTNNIVVNHSLQCKLAVC